jgi:hypothetical protein
MRIIVSFLLAVGLSLGVDRAAACDREISSAFDQITAAPFAVIADVRGRGSRWNARVVRVLAGAAPATIPLATGGGCDLAFGRGGRYLLFLEPSGAGYLGYDSAFFDPSNAFVDALLGWRGASSAAERHALLVDALASGDAAVSLAARNYLYRHPDALRGANAAMRSRFLSALARASNDDLRFLSTAAAASFGAAALSPLVDRFHGALPDDDAHLARVLACATGHVEAPGSRSDLARRWRSWLARGEAFTLPPAAAIDHCVRSLGFVPADVFTASETAEWIVVATVSGGTATVERVLRGPPLHTVPLSTEAYSGIAIPASGRLLLLLDSPLVDGEPMSPDNGALLHEWRAADAELVRALEDWVQSPNGRPARLLGYLASPSQALVREAGWKIANLPAEIEPATGALRRRFVELARRCSDACVEDLAAAFVALRWTEAASVLEDRARRSPDYAESFRRAAASLRR